MSILGAFESFGAKLRNELKKIFGNTTWEQEASGVIMYVGPLLTTAVTLLGGPAIGAAVNAVVARVQTSLATLSAVVTDINTNNPIDATGIQVAETTLTQIQADLPEILSAAQVKDAATISKVSVIIDSITTEVNSLLQGLAGVKANPAVPPAGSASTVVVKS